ncbi:MAG: hypothetical protein AAFY53_15140 [Pseudomonadota bacterium]
MVTVEALLFAALGFLVAGLLTVLFAPLYWSRAVRLTTDDIKSKMPLTENQIAADRGLLQAEHAVAVNALEGRLTALANKSASARVEINRRDARIADLEQRLKANAADLAANENARRVLERTIMDRVPDVERHLRDAREQLLARDDELNQLRTQAQKTFRALDEAMQISEQQRDDIVRLKDQLASEKAARTASETKGPAEGRSAEAEVVELRAKLRTQSELVARLQRLLGSGVRPGDAVIADAAPGSSQTPSENDEARPGSAAKDGNAAFADPVRLSLEAELQAAKGRIDDRDREIRAIKADLAALEDQADDELVAATPSSWKKRVAGEAVDGTSLKTLTAARILIDDQEEAIQRLRSELAASNERLARQATQYQDELRKLGGAARRQSLTRGSPPTPGAKPAEDDSRAKSTSETRQTPSQKGSLMRRIGERTGANAASPASPKRNGAAPAGSSTSGTDAQRPTPKPKPDRVDRQGAGAVPRRSSGNGIERPTALAATSRAETAAPTKLVNGRGGHEPKGGQEAWSGKDESPEIDLEISPGMDRGESGLAAVKDPEPAVSSPRPERRRGLLARISDLDGPRSDETQAAKSQSDKSK